MIILDTMFSSRVLGTWWLLLRRFPSFYLLQMSRNKTHQLWLLSRPKIPPRCNWDLPSVLKVLKLNQAPWVQTKTIPTCLKIHFQFIWSLKTHNEIHILKWRCLVVTIILSNISKVNFWFGGFVWLSTSFGGSEDQCTSHRKQRNFKYLGSII